MCAAYRFTSRRAFLLDARSQCVAVLLLRGGRAVLGDVASTYLDSPRSPERSRIVVKLLVPYAPLSRLAEEVFPLADLVMMRSNSSR